MKAEEAMTDEKQDLLTRQMNIDNIKLSSLYYQEGI